MKNRDHHTHSVSTLRRCAALHFAREDFLFLPNLLHLINFMDLPVSGAETNNIVETNDAYKSHRFCIEGFV